MNTEFDAGLKGSLRPLGNVLELLQGLAALAAEQAKKAAERQRAARRPRRGSTLRPGNDTPLWNAVVERVRPHLAAHGAKANLARVLEVPRQRVHDYFVTGAQMPDAERLLHVLLWLDTRETPADAKAGRKSPKPLH